MELLRKWRCFYLSEAAGLASRDLDIKRRFISFENIDTGLQGAYRMLPNWNCSEKLIVFRNNFVFLILQAAIQECSGIPICVQLLYATRSLEVREYVTGILYNLSSAVVCFNFYSTTHRFSLCYKYEWIRVFTLSSSCRYISMHTNICNTHTHVYIHTHV